MLLLFVLEKGLRSPVVPALRGLAVSAFGSEERQLFLASGTMILLSEGRGTMRQFIKFGMVAVSNTIISYMIYLACLRLMERYGMFSQVDYLISSLIAFFISVLWSFYWNNKFTFKQEAKEKLPFTVQCH